MKTFKKALTVAVAGAMALALNAPAFAANITINNAANGETYTAYKLFDMTKSGEGSDVKYSYYIENIEKNKDLIELLDTTIGLDLVKSADDSQYIVKTTTSGDTTLFATDDKEGMTAAALAAELGEYISSLTPAKEGVEASAGTAVISDLADGYYFIDTSLGSLCILNSSDQVINEKNSVPSIDKKVYEDSEGKYVDGKTGAQDKEYATIDVTDIIKYQLTVNTGSNAHGTGTGIDGNFVITDDLPDGITYIDKSVEISDTDWEIGTDYTVSYEAGTLTITLLSTGKLSELGQNADIVITYEATADDLDTRVDYTNTVTLTYKEQTSTDTANVKTYEIGENASGEPTITKVDGDGNKLQSVKFVLKNNTTGEYATFDKTTHYLTGWVDTQAAATPLVTDKNGNIFAYGLDADSYTLIETETLPGYNLLDGTIAVVIAEDGTVTYDLTSDDDGAADTITIVNEAGSILPSTGGMGTTVLYIAGAALVLGAGITLVVRRRMNSDR